MDLGKELYKVFNEPIMKENMSVNLKTSNDLQLRPQRPIYGQSGKTIRDNSSIYNRIYQPQNSMSLFHKYGLGLDVNKDNKFIVGSLYSLKGSECEGFSMPDKIYELIKIVDVVDGIVLESLIMKQINTEVKSTIFSLTKGDCAALGIEFQEGLQLFPKNMNWKYVENQRESDDIDMSDLSTYVKSDVDGTIRHIIIKLDGFSSYQSTHIITNNGDIINTADFVSDLRVETLHEILSIDMCSNFKQGERIPYRIINNKINKPKYGENAMNNIEGSIYIELDFKKSTKYINQTCDGYIGLSPKALQGKTISDLFTISWRKRTDQTNSKPKKRQSDSWLMDFEDNFLPIYDGNKLYLGYENDFNKKYETKIADVELSYQQAIDRLCSKLEGHYFF